MTRDPTIADRSFRVKFIPPTKLAYVRAYGSYEHSSEKAWQSIFKWLERRGHHATPGRGYGFANDDPATTKPNDLRYDACVRVPDLWHPTDKKYVNVGMFGGGTFALHRVVGPYANIIAVTAHVRSIALNREGLIYDPSHPVMTFFHDDPRTTDPELQRADIGIPVVPDRRPTDQASKRILPSV